MSQILLVEDTKTLQLTYAKMLSRLGNQVTIAEHGQKAVESANEHQFDLILMDLNMPIMDGFDATITLRSQGHTLPIVALTANASEDNRQRCQAIGFNDFACKPIDQKSIGELISKNMG